VHIDASPKDLPSDLVSFAADDALINKAFQTYIGGPGAFVFEHENRHVQQTLAYPALYLRAVREYQWARAALSDFRERGDLPYDPSWNWRLVVDPSHSDVQRIRRSYYVSVSRYAAGGRADGQFSWGEDSALSEVIRKRSFSEAKLLEAEAMAAQYALARARGVGGPFRVWARARGQYSTYR
jgi:hypothetical protein